MALVDVGRDSRAPWPLPHSARLAEVRLVESEAHVETLCAIVVWRQLIDDACRDPREELAFQVNLSDYGETLRLEGGSVTDA